jgi:hypothetical protein
VHQLLDERLAYAEQGGNGSLRPKVLVAGPQDLLPQVERIGFHALDRKTRNPYKQVKTAIEVQIGGFGAKT